MDLPDKVYFRIGEVAKALGVQPHVVRFWQQQFPTVRPERSKTGRFLYTKNTVEQLAFIQKLLKDEGYTIAGAKKALRERGSATKRKAAQKATEAPANKPGKVAAANAGADAKAVADLKKQLKSVQNERDSLKAQLSALKKVVNREVDTMATLLVDE